MATIALTYNVPSATPALSAGMVALSFEGNTWGNGVLVEWSLDAGVSYQPVSMPPLKYDVIRGRMGVAVDVVAGTILRFTARTPSADNSVIWLQ